MKKINKTLIALGIFIIALFLYGNVSFGAHNSSQKWLGLYNKGNGRPTGFYTSGTTTGVKSSIPVIKIVEYTSSAGTVQKGIQPTVYCIKDGVGFGAPGSSGEVVNYSEYFDLKDPDNATNPITGSYRAALPSGSNYNKLLWLLDNIAMTDSTESINELLNKAGLTKVDFITDRTGSTNGMTDAEFVDIIEVIQQAAIWYFTNAGDDFQPSINSAFHVASTNGGTGVSLSGKYNLDLVDDPIRILYRYLIDEAERNGSYTPTADNADAVTFDKSRATVSFENGNILVGPYRVTGNLNSYTLNAKVLNGTTEITNVKLVASNKSTVILGSSTTEKIKSNLNKDFYISLPANTDITRIGINLRASFKTTRMTYWSAPSTQGSQPVVIIDRENVSKEYSDEKTITKPTFDVSLRKYITALNGTNLSSDKTREPAVDVGPLKSNNTTARYNHTKEPIKVSENDIITYTIRVYNEGEIDGYVDEIVDHLPPELEFLPNDSINQQYGWQIDSSDSSRRTIKTTYLSKENGASSNLLTKFNKNGNSLASKYIQIRCRVKEGAETDKIITNIAEITRSSNEFGYADRDNKNKVSMPSDSNLPSYKGKDSNKNELNDKNYYYEGQEDDDDFEKVFIEREITGNYGVKIVKVDSTNESKLLSGAVFTVNNVDKTATNANGETVVESNKTITNASQTDRYTIVEKTAPTGYNKFDGSIELTVKTKVENEQYIVDTANTTMVVKNNSGAVITENIPVTIDKNAGLITIKVKDTPIVGSYGVKIVKVDSTNENKLLSGAVFTVNNIDKTATNEVGETVVESNKTITSSSQTDRYTIVEKTAPEGYDKFDGSIELTVKTKLENGQYVVDTANTTMVVKNSSGAVINENIPVTIDKDVGIITIKVKDTPIVGNYGVKIVKVDSTNESKLLSGAVFTVNNIDKTATNEVGETVVESNKTITSNSQTDKYTIVEKTAPEGYNKFDGSIELTVKTKLENGQYVVDTANTTMVVKNSSGAVITENIPVTMNKDSELITIKVKDTPIVGNYGVKIVKVDSTNENKLLSGAVFTVNNIDKKATNENGETVVENNKTIASNSQTDKYTIVEKTAPEGYNKFDGSIELTVKTKLENGQYVVDTENTTMEVKDNSGVVINENIPVTIDKDAKLITIKVKNYQFDLKLIKRITEVNSRIVPERIQGVDITSLANGTKTTANYRLDKEPVEVNKGDIVKYTLRIYNEGQLDGYASEITEDIPEGLEFLWSDKSDEELKTDKTFTDAEKEAIKFNRQMLWSKPDENGMIRTNYLSKEQETEEKSNLIKAFNSEREYSVKEPKNPDYKEVSVMLKVVSENTRDNIIRNEACISKDTDKDGNPVTDRDSEPEKWVKYEDDEDYDNIILKSFDLALRKFITGVNDTEITNRVPQIDKSNFGKVVDGKEIRTLTYNHTKEPVRVAQNDTVIYTIRVYNEGTKSGYAAEIKDDIPDGLEFIIDNDINKTYRWVMYDKDGNITEDVKKATTIRTDYLSKDQEKSANENLLNAFDFESGEDPDYRDVKVAFKVLEPNTSDRIIINHAEISKDTDKNGDEVDDIDSTPDKWIEDEDDQDIEKIYVKYFDLALRKWVSQAIIIEDGVQKEMDTGHYAEQEPEPAVKVELNKKKIENTIVKFRYQIRITNEGEIEGYATEISDYIPEGLKFNQADNPKWKEVNGKIVTDQLKDTLLKPGESATVEVVLTWINGEDNMGTKVNVAEISEDKNDSDTPDIDSVPDNKKEGEDDIDDAPVVLTVITGSAPKYIAIISAGLAIVGVGIFTIKKYVL